mmetsp:Transcript_7607/g.17049  ORF Transcript_7607/g.17049 Transcript_7607/m.17049 type:complete len:235 (+) Transcript_7607:1223-1927(+)
MPKSSSVVNLLWSTANVTKLFASSSGASVVIWLCPTRKISKFEQSAKLAGNDVSLLCSASRVFKCLSLPMDSGSDVKPLPLMMSVNSPERRLISGESCVKDFPRFNFKLLMLETKNNAGSTSVSPFSRSMLTSLASLSFALTVSGHRASGAFSATFFVSCAPSLFAPPLPGALFSPRRSSASISFFLRLLRCVDVSPSNPSSSSISSSSSSSSSLESPPRSIRLANASNPPFRA